MCSVQHIMEVRQAFQELPFPVSASDQQSDDDEASDSGVDSAMLSESSYSAGAASRPISAKYTNECALSLGQSQESANSLRRAHSLPVKCHGNKQPGLTSSGDGVCMSAFYVRRE